MPWLTVSRRFILPLLVAAAVRAQCPNSIVAGPASTYSGDGQPATSAFLFNPSSLTVDIGGNLYIADSGNNRIRKVTPDGVIHTVAGPDGLDNPQFVLAAPDGSVYIADSGHNRIVQLTASGALNVIAGTGHPGYSGDNSAAIGAELNDPLGMGLDSKGNLYFADSNNGAIRRVDTNGVISTVASLADGASAIAVASDGTIFVAAPYSQTVVKVTPDGRTSNFGPSGANPSGLILLSDGSLLVVNRDLLELSPDGQTLSYYARTEDATAAALGAGGIYYIAPGNVVYHAATPSSEPALFAGQFYTGNGPDNVSALGPRFGAIAGMAVGPDGSIWVGDAAYGKIRKILPGGIERVVASNVPTAFLALDSSGNLYAAGGASVWKIAAGGAAGLFAGGGAELIPVMGAPPIQATSVSLADVSGVATDSAGDLYVLSSVYGYQTEILITRTTPAGQLTTIFDSTTVPSSSGLYLLTEGITQGLALDSQGYMLAAVNWGRTILRIAPDGSGVFQELALPDYAAAVAASPTGETFYLTESGRIKARNAGATLYHRDVPVSPDLDSGVMLERLLTTPIPGIPGIGIPAGPGSLATDASGNVYFADATVTAIRRFPVDACFTVRAPQISVDAPVSPITPPTSGVTFGSPTSTSTTSTTTTSTTTTSTSTTCTTTTILTSTGQGEFYAPGELISIYGTGLGPQIGANAQADSNGFIGTQLGGTQVFMEGVAAPVLYTSDGRVNAVVPFNLYGYGEISVQVAYNGVLSDAITIEMLPAAPIVFTDNSILLNGPIVINQDGSRNSPSNPAAPGSIITFYGSGFGVTAPTGSDGHLASALSPKPALPITASIDCIAADVFYAGDVVGLVEGVVQVNLRVPQGASGGYVSVTAGDYGMNFQIFIAH